MAIVAGDVQEITYNHPTLGSGSFQPVASEDFTIDRGGIRGMDEASSITSQGQNINRKSRVRWSFEGPIAIDNEDQDTDEVLNQLAASTEPADWTFQMISGTVYQGKGAPVGDLQGNAQQGTISLKVSGGGRLTKL